MSKRKSEENPLTVHRKRIARSVLRTPDALFPFLSGGYKSKKEASEYLRVSKKRK